MSVSVENQPVDMCYCVIAHPDKRKFLAVKHSEGWSPPTLKIPAGLIDYHAQNINQAMLKKYGLATRVLRPMVRIKGHQYVELELARPGACRPIKAVWVDQGEYLRTRAASPLQPDPLETWFLGWRNPQRQRQLSPWQVTGWFAQAEAWILHQAERLGYAPSGPVEQFRSGWIRSCLLRVPTIQGWLYFKAGELVQPLEVALTESLAAAWPGYVQPPLAADLTRNWMLNHDYYHDAERIRDPQLLPRFAAAMGHIQAESAGSLQRWHALGCQ